MTEYEQGWKDAFKAIADYVEAEVCPVTAEMIRRIRDEKWRKMMPLGLTPRDGGQVPRRQRLKRPPNGS
jgi:hypothetical protein